MITSTVGNYTAQTNSGVITLSHEGTSVLVGFGSSVQLVESSSLYLYWIASTGALRRAPIVGTTLGLVETIASSVTSFFALAVDTRGIAYAYLSSGSIHLDILGSVVTNTWPSERLSDFSFDISNDLNTISVLYKRPGSPIQAYVEQYLLSQEQLACSTPIIQPASWTYNHAITVTITCQTTGSSIRYTTDGSEPNSGSELYVSGFSVSESCAVKAIASAPDLLDSSVAIAQYNIVIPVPTTTRSYLRLLDFAFGVGAT